jgi:hypothetical protein
MSNICLLSLAVPLLKFNQSLPEALKLLVKYANPMKIEATRNQLPIKSSTSVKIGPLIYMLPDIILR